MREILDLQLFADGEAATAEKGSATQNISEDTKDENITDFSEKKSFDDLIKGEYKAEFTKKVNSIIAKRFKAEKGEREKMDALSDAFSPAMERYKAESLYGLAEILSREEPLEKEGKESVIKAKREDMMKALNEKAATDKIYNGFIEESEKIKKIYDDFDFRKELLDPTFSSGLRLGMDMMTLYRALHFDQIKEAITVEALKKAEAEKRLNSLRPREVGSSSPSSFTTKTDVNALTDSQMEEIEKRIIRGEHISFSD